MRIVLLAAGDGGRLRPLTDARPKALVDVAGAALIDHVVESFVEAGARDFVVVLGYEGEQLRAHLESVGGARFQFVWNPDYWAGNARSLFVAADVLGDEPFVLAMGDHLLSVECARLALSPRVEENCVLVDRAPPPAVIEEATRVLVDEGGVVRAIGKELVEWNAVDIGLFRLRGDAVAHLATLPLSAELNDAWSTLVARRELRAADVGGAWWADIDTESDLVRASARLLERKRYGRRPNLAISEP